MQLFDIFQTHILFKVEFPDFRLFFQEGSVVTWTYQLGYQSKVIIVFPIGLSFFRIEKVISCNQFKNHASQWPNVRWLVVFTSQDYFGRSVLSGLNDVWIVVCNVASISHVTEFHVDIFFLHTGYIALTKGAKRVVISLLWGQPWDRANLKKPLEPLAVVHEWL